MINNVILILGMQQSNIHVFILFHIPFSIRLLENIEELGRLVLSRKPANSYFSPIHLQTFLPLPVKANNFQDYVYDAQLIVTQ